MWRRFFELKKEEEEEQIEEIRQNLQDAVEEIWTEGGTVAAPEVVDARMQFSKDFQREALHGQPAREALLTPQHVLAQPNLQVPLEQEFIYRAQ